MTIEISHNLKKCGMVITQGSAEFFIGYFAMECSCNNMPVYSHRLIDTILPFKTLIGTLADVDHSVLF